MQRFSRLVSTATTTSCKDLLLPHIDLTRLRLGQSVSLASTTGGRPAGTRLSSDDCDVGFQPEQPAVPHGNPEETKQLYEPETGKRDVAETEQYRPSSKCDPLATPKPPAAASPRLENTGVTNPAEPLIQQKRKYATAGTTKETTATLIKDASCAGLDGSPWSKETNGEEDDAEYFKHHKASPLSEIKVADTRKPITRATDGTYGSTSLFSDVIGWLPEQLDTAEEALERARKIWQENAMRGDPHSPHGRVLRELRGDRF